MNDLIIQGLVVDWNEIEDTSWLRSISALKNLERLDFSAPVTFFAGENGSGKSTLLEAIAVAYGFNPEGGTRNYAFSTYDSHSNLYDAMTLIKGYRRPAAGYFLRAESFYNVATKELEYLEYDSQRYHEKSHGEGFMALAQNQLKPNGIYLLGEPEAALSPQRQLSLLLEIYELTKKGAQFIIATHSPILLGTPGAEILSFDGGRIHPCEYEETDSYQITKMFIDDREGILRKLLDQ